ncbi:MAG TPA: hypothetical protein VNX68_07665 [Nitrosopumilaceae archaeon]|jgi:hypothetical protein|nr:hypothetical protein [Nitrosopumilaceae archaeon]
MLIGNLSLRRRQQLTDAVIHQIKRDAECGDTTVLDDLLKFIPEENLVQALPEEEWKDFPEVDVARHLKNYQSEQQKKQS